MKNFLSIEKHISSSGISSLDELTKHINRLLLKVVGSVFFVAGILTSVYCFFIDFKVLMWGSLIFSLISGGAALYKTDSFFKNYLMVNIFQLGLIIPITIVCVSYKGISGPIAYSYLVVPVLALVLGGSIMSLLWLIISMGIVTGLAVDVTWIDMLTIKVDDPENLFLLLINQATIALFFIMLKEINKKIINYLFDMYTYGEQRTQDLKNMINNLSFFQTTTSSFNMAYPLPVLYSKYNCFDDISNSILKASDDIQASLSNVMKKSQLGDGVRSIGHEINNHLQILSGASEYIQMVVKDNNPKINKKVAAIKNSVFSLKSISSMALYGKTTRKQRSSVNEVIDHISYYIDSFSISEDHIRFHTLGSDGTFEEHRGALFNILLNLIKNSVEEIKKSNPINGKVELTFDSRFNGHLRVCLTDNGSGIPFEKLDALNNNKDVISSKLDGNGLGLIFVKNECQLNGFNLDIQSNSILGTKILIDIESFEIGNSQ